MVFKIPDISENMQKIVEQQNKVFQILNLKKVTFILSYYHIIITFKPLYLDVLSCHDFFTISKEQIQLSIFWPSPSKPLPNPFPTPSESPWPPPVAAPLKMQVVRPVGSDGLLAKELGHVSLARFAFT